MEAPAVVDLSASLVPLTIRHADLDLSWSVLDVLEDWTTPSFHDDRGGPMETKRLKVRVTGPLPGRPTETGRVLDDRAPIRRPPGMVDLPGAGPALSTRAAARRG
jgi:hypothetical protein